MAAEVQHFLMLVALNLHGFVRVHTCQKCCVLPLKAGSALFDGSCRSVEVSPNTANLYDFVRVLVRNAMFYQTRRSVGGSRGSALFDVSFRSV